jgi:hypothetical protein
MLTVLARCSCRNRIRNAFVELRFAERVSMVFSTIVPSIFSVSRSSSFFRAHQEYIVFYESKRYLAWSVDVRFGIGFVRHSRSIRKAFLVGQSTKVRPKTASRALCERSRHANRCLGVSGSILPCLGCSRDLPGDILSSLGDLWGPPGDPWGSPASPRALPGGSWSAPGVSLGAS